MSDFGVKSSQIINILPIFGVSIQKNYVTQKVLMLSFAALAAGGSLSAQNLIVGADFATRFDNREYANNDFNESQTLFSARFTPRIGVEWMEKNRLIFGVDLLQNFGQAQRRPRTVPERRETADILPVQQQERTGQRRYLRPQGAAGRLFEGVLQRLDGVLPQPPVGFPRAL